MKSKWHDMPQRKEFHMTDTVAAKAPEAEKLNFVESYVRSKERQSEGSLANSRDGIIQAMREDFHSVLCQSTCWLSACVLRHPLVSTNSAPLQAASLCSDFQSFSQFIWPKGPKPPLYFLLVLREYSLEKDHYGHENCAMEVYEREFG